MRRENLDFSYKKRTRELINNIYDPWQVQTKVESEFESSLANRIISIAEGVREEIDYVQRKFFPDLMDINEEWLVHETEKEITPEELYIDSIPLVDLIQEAESIDEFISGPYNLFTIKSEYLNISNIKDVVSYGTKVVVLTDTNILVYNNSELETKIDIKYGDTVTELIYANSENYDYPLKNEAVNLSVKDSNGNSIYHIYYDKTKTNGEYEEKLDHNKDGIINQTERALLESVRGKRSSDFELEEWDKLRWLDVNEDDIIGEFDYKYIKNILPAMRENIPAFITIPSVATGIYTASYNIREILPFSIVRRGSTYSTIMEDNPLLKKFSIIETTNNEISYVSDLERKTLRAIRIDGENNIEADAKIYIKLVDKESIIIDIAYHEGYIFVLIKDSASYKIYYEDTLQEYLEYIDRYATVDFEDYDVKGMTIDISGSFYFFTEDKVLLGKAHRDKYIVINNKVYTNRPYNLTDEEGNSINTLPWTIFNSFDSFAYSFGIERPHGCDNTQMKNIIYDIYKYPQGNHPIGINYGIKREIGITNTPNSYIPLEYTLPAELSLEDPIKIAGSSASIINDNGIYLSGDFGLIEHIVPDKLIFPEEIHDIPIINIEGSFISGNNTKQNIDYDILLDSFHIYPDIEVYSLGDPEYFNSDKCLYSIDEIKEKIEFYEKNDPFIYKNAIVDRTPLDKHRVSMTPAIPTIYGHELKSEDEDIIII